MHEANESVREANASVREANASVREANASVHEANVSAQEANVSAQEANASVREANASVREANVSVQEANASVQEANASVQEANASVQEANVTVHEANATVHKANAIAQEANVTVHERHEIQSYRPAVADGSRAATTRNNAPTREGIAVGTAKKTKQAKNDSKPRQEFNEIGQLALKAQDLANQYQAQLGARLSAAFLAGFGTDITALTAAVPTVITTKQGTVQLTVAQSVALANGYNLLKGIRTTVKGFGPDESVLLAYGVGNRVSKLLVKEVLAALQKIVARITAEPAEAASFDIVAADTTALNAAIAAINLADQTQEQGRASAPQATKNRNAIARRLLAGVKKIAGAGMRTFNEDATTFANFEALITRMAS